MHVLSSIFSIDLIAIDVRIYMFFDKTPTNNFPFASFSLVQFLLIVLSVKVTSISNGSLAWVAYSQGCASAGSRAHLVIEPGPSIERTHIFSLLLISELIFSVLYNIL